MNLKNLKNVDYKELALKHGDKVVCGIAGLLFLLFAYSGITKAFKASDPNLTPEVIQGLAQKLKNSVQNSQFTDTVASEVNPDATSIDKINPDFAGDVERLKNPVDPKLFAWSQWFFKFEDFGAILRQQPEIFQPEALEAYPEIASTWMYKRNASGDFIEVDPEKALAKRRARNEVAKKIEEREKRSTAGPGATGRTRSTGRQYIDLAELEEPEKETAAQEGENTAAQKAARGRTKAYEEEVHGFSAVVVTALFPHLKQVREFGKKLHTPEQPDYAKIEVQRRQLESNGAFSDWMTVDRQKIKYVEDSIPYWEIEHSQLEAALFDPLISGLPKLAVGEWEASVDRIEALVAARKAFGAIALTETEEQEYEQPQMAEDQPVTSETNSVSSYAQSSGYRGGSARGGRGSGQSKGYGDVAKSYKGGGATGGQGTGANMMKNTPNASMGTAPGVDPQEVLRRALEGVRGRKSVRLGRGALETKVTRAEQIQIRFVDYTAETGHSYQYRIKVFVKNPNLGYVNVADEAYKKDEFLSGEWSTESPVVYVPTGLQYYVLDSGPRGRADIQVQKWSPEMGDWQIEEFRPLPGDLIGQESRSYEWVNFDNELQRSNFDFSTNKLLVDVAGGDRKFYLEDYGTITAQVPTQILVLDEFGGLESRNQADDISNPTRADRAKDRQDLLESARLARSETSKSSDSDAPVGKTGYDRTAAGRDR